MSHTRGKDKTDPSKFAYECFDWNGNLFRAEGGFATHQEADAAASNAEREMTIVAMGGTIEPAYKMTDQDWLDLEDLLEGD